MRNLMLLAFLLIAPAVARGQTADEIIAANIKASGGEEHAGDRFASR